MHLLFDSISALLDYLETTDTDPHIAANLSGTLASQKRGAQRAEWADSKSYREAFNRLAKGWPEGEKHLHEIDAEITANTTAQIETQSFDVVGEYVDIGRVVSGDPENMVTTTVSDRPHANVYMGLGATADVTAEDMRRYVASVLASVLSAKDRMSIDLYAYSAVSRTGAPKNLDNCTIIKVLGSDDVLDLARITGIFCSISFLRRLVFRIRETDPDCYGIVTDGGYGCTTTITDHQLAAMQLPAGAIIPSFITQPDVKRILTEAGITVH